MKYGIEINQRVGKNIKRGWFEKISEKALGEVGVGGAAISIAIVGDREMKNLNKKWRGKNRVTDVLSFVYENKPLAGEIIICLPQAVRQAEEGGRGVAEEIKMLLIHGLLHLAGYDHERGARQAREMEKLQNKITVNC